MATHELGLAALPVSYRYHFQEKIGISNVGLNSLLRKQRPSLEIVKFTFKNGMCKYLKKGLMQVLVFDFMVQTKDT